MSTDRAAAPPRSTLDDDAVVVDVPARPRSLRLLRLAAADAAADLDMDIDGVEAARIAVDELGALLLGSGSWQRLVVRIEVSAGQLTVRGSTTGAGAPAPVQVDRIVQELLDTCVDEWRVEDGDDGPTFRFSMAAPDPAGAAP